MIEDNTTEQTEIVDESPVETTEAAIELEAKPAAAIKPTVGRMVWYRPSDEQVSLRGLTKLDDQPFSAQIVHVTDDYTVNLSVYDHNGTRFAATNVYLQPNPEVPVTAPYAQWMTYQLEVAK